MPQRRESLRESLVGRKTVNPDTGKVWTDQEVDNLKFPDQPDAPTPSQMSVSRSLVKDGQVSPILLQELTTAELVYYYGDEEHVDVRKWAELYKRLNPVQRLELDCLKERYCWE